MAELYSKRKIVLLQISSFCMAICLAQHMTAQTGIQPVTVVQTADRVPLYPFKDHDSRNFIYPNVIRKYGTLIVFTSRQFDILEMISGNGVIVFQENIKGRTGRFDIPIKSSSSSGINYVRLRNKETTLIQKVMVIE